MNQNEAVVKIVKIGKCPVCGKGKMMQGSAGWTCDYFKTWEDKCTFTIFASYYGYKLQEKDALEIINNGKTKALRLQNREGEWFTGCLKLVDGKIKAVPVETTLNAVCPHCGGEIIETANGYACRNYFSKDETRKCNIFISKVACNRAISIEEAEQTFNNGYSEVLDGFTENNGKRFSSIITIKKNGAVLDGRVTTCPICGGDVYPGEKAFNCSNFRNPSVRCGFTIWRTIGNKKITVEQVRKLCGAERRTEKMTFTSRDGKTFDRELFLNEDNVVKFI
jgi:predicted RNA-binding Zn-ribbon protein involved in translation (DUF1610 family)